MKILLVGELFLTGRTGIAEYIVDNFPGESEICATVLFNKIVEDMYQEGTEHGPMTLQSVIADYIIDNNMLTEGKPLFTGLMGDDLKVKLLSSYPSYRNFVDCDTLSNEDKINITKETGLVFSLEDDLDDLEDEGPCMCGECEESIEAIQRAGVLNVEGFNSVDDFVQSIFPGAKKVSLDDKDIPDSVKSIIKGVGAQQI